jgi:hypothetical protein
MCRNWLWYWKLSVSMTSNTFLMSLIKIKTPVLKIFTYIRENVQFADKLKYLTVLVQLIITKFWNILDYATAGHGLIRSCSICTFPTLYKHENVEINNKWNAKCLMFDKILLRKLFWKINLIFCMSVITQYYVKLLSGITSLYDVSGINPN